MTKPKTFSTVSPNDFMIALGNRLKDARSQLKMIQKDFAEKLGVSASFLSELEKGKTTPGIFVLIRLSQVFNISMDYLICGEGKPLKQKPGKSTHISLEIDPNHPDKEKIIDLFKYLNESSIVRYSVLLHFMDLMHKQKDLIEENLKKEKKY